MFKRPLVPIAIAFAAGVLASDASGWRCHILYVVPIVSAWLFVRKDKHSSALLLLLVFFMGFMRFTRHSEIAPNDVCHYVELRPPMISGTVVSEPDVRENKVIYIAAVERVLVAGVWKKCGGRVRIAHYDDPSNVPKFGDRIIARVQMSLPEEAGNPGAFSWKRYLARQGVHSTARIYPGQKVEVISGSGANIAARTARTARNALASSVDHLFNKPESQVITGMTLGSYTILPDDIVTGFSKTGTLHLLAASGFNCGVLVAGLGFPLRKLRLAKKLRHPILVAALIAYMMVVGTKASIIRATIMAILGLIAVNLKRPVDLLNLLFAAALIILVIWPSDLFDPGFQLSFAAVLGIVMIYPLLEKMILQENRKKKDSGILKRVWRRAKYTTVQSLITTIAAMLTTTPISMQTFNHVSLVMLPANMLVAFAVLPVFAVGLVSPAVEYLPLLRELAVFIGTISSRFVLAIISLLGKGPFSSLNIPSPGWISLAGYYVILGAGIVYGFRFTQKR